MKDFKEYCKDYIVDHIDEFVGQNFYGSDLCYELTQEPNSNGTLTFCREEAVCYLKDWWVDAAKYWDYEKDNFGENTHNPFDNPEAYMVCMVIEGVASILGNAPHIEDYWNDEFELTQEMAEDIKYYVTDFDGDIF